MTTATTTSWTCRDCNRPMLTKTRTRHRATDFPDGTVMHTSGGRCSSCYITFRRAENQAEDRESANVLTGGAWVRGRHGILHWKGTA